MWLSCRERAAAKRIEQWAAVWQSAEGRTVGATEHTVQRFRQLVVCASRLAATVRWARLPPLPSPPHHVSPPRLSLHLWPALIRLGRADGSQHGAARESILRAWNHAPAVD